MLPTSIPRSPPWQTTSTWLRTCTRCAPGYASNRRGVSVDFNPRPRLLRCQPSGRPVYHRTTYSDALKLLVKAGRLRRERRRNDWYYSLGDGQAVMISKITAQPTRSQGSPTTQPRRNQPAASPQPVRSQDSPTTQPRRNDSATDAPICSHNHRPVPMKVARCGSKKRAAFTGTVPTKPPVHTANRWNRYSIRRRSQRKPYPPRQIQVFRHSSLQATSRVMSDGLARRPGAYQASSFRTRTPALTYLNVNE